MADDYSTLIDQAGQKWNVDPKLISTIIGVESSGNPNAVGPPTKYGTAVGLGQLIPATAKSLGVTDPTDPRQAIPAVAQLLSQNLDRYGNVADAVAAYHGGTDKANWGPKTQAYVQKVSAQYGGQQPSAQQPAQSAQPSQNPAADAAMASLGMTPKAISQPVQNNAPTGTVDPFADISSSHPSASAPQSGMVDPFANIDTHAKTDSTPQSGGFLSQVGDAATAFGHHVMSPLHGAAQLVEHGVNSAVQAVAPGSDFANAVQKTVSADDQALINREKQYQATTPDNIGSYTGAVAGEIAPALVAGGARLLQGGADAGAALASRLGLGSTGTGAAQLAGASAASAGLGAATAATAPVTQQGNYGLNKALQIGTGATIGAITPAAGALAGKAGQYVGNVARSIVDPLTDAGQQRIAQNTLQRFAAGGPTASNTSQLVAGSQPTLAEATGNAGIAGLQRTMRDLNPNDFAAREEQNAAARLAQVDAVRGTADDIATAQAARDAQVSPALQTVFSKAQPTNTAPVVSAIDSVLSGPGGQRSAVQSSLNTIKNMVTDANGNPISADPNVLYQSVRKQIGDMLDARMTNANPAGLQASRELLGVRDQLDNAIEQGAPGFKQYLSDYSTASQPISAMEHLQGLNLTDANGNVTLAKVQNALTNIKKQQGASGANNAKSIDPQQMEQLEAVRDDLLRQSSLGKGKSVGSATAQNLAFQNSLSTMLPGKIGAAIGNVGPAGIGSAIGGAGGLLVGGLPGAGIGASAGGFIGKAVGAAMNGQNSAIQAKLNQLLLNPQSGIAALNSSPAGRSAAVNRLLPYLAPSVVGAGNGLFNAPSLQKTP